MQIKYTLLLNPFLIVFSFLAIPQATFAEDTLYTIVCNCDPDIHSDAVAEISSQVSPHSGEFGNAGGFENGDEVIIKNVSGSEVARWEINIPPGSWSDNSSAGFGCDNNFDTCVDLTGQNIGPPWEEHDPNHGAPANLQVTWAFGYCHQCDCTEWETSHSATNVISFAVEHSSSSTGPWTTYSSTGGSMSYPHNGTNGRWYQINASNTAGSIFSSPIWKTGNNCSNCGPGGQID